ncbi:13991_t:CDS:2 [Entrophospora sp. SA101]|nr:13991_t:CDS:2 [Entrophospora sp. SA101]
MNNSIIAIDILPCNDGKVIMYGAPDKDATVKLSGKLRIVLSKPLKTKFVAIQLKGKSEFSDWENQYSCINVAKYENIIREKFTLPLGVTDLDYEFELPANIPQTYVTPFGLIKYKLVATVQPASLLTKYGRVEKPITFHRHYLPCKRDLLPAPPTKVYKGQRKDILKYELDVPTITCIDDKSILVRLRLLPLTDQGKIEKVSFDMIQSEKYRIHPTNQDLRDFAIDGAQLVGNVQLSGSSSLKRVRSHPIKPTTLNIHHDDDCWNSPLTCNLPFTSHAISDSDSSKKTKLKASIKKLTFPITITTVPEKNDFDGGLPSYDDVIGIRYHKLRQKKSQNSLAQSLGKLLLRSDSKSKSKSKSSTPSISASTSPKTYSLTSSSSSDSTSSLASLATTDQSSDNDDDNPEIRSAPSSPLQSKFHGIEFNISLPSPTLGF